MQAKLFLASTGLAALLVLWLTLNTALKVRQLLHPSPPVREATIIASSGISIIDGIVRHDAAVAWARYTPSFHRIGWYQLEISASNSPAHSDVAKARAAGVLEAFYQAREIHNYWTNYRLNEYKRTGGRPPEALKAYVDQQSKWVNAQVAAQKRHSKFWATMELVVAQFDGLCEGYWRYAEAGRNLTWTELYLLNSVGDLYDLNVKYHDDESTARYQDGEGSGGRHGGQGAGEYRPTPGHGMLGEGGYGDMLECSALIKLRTSKRGHRSFLAAHTTWRPFYAMVRTFKTYHVPWGATGPLQIASSPGLLHSKDDWYTTDRLVVMETTNGVYNASLYDRLGPECALTWQRVQVANFAATSAAEWVQLFATAASGTYNNQWMVLDSHVLDSGASSDALWILEQIPGYSRSADVTSVLLEQGYWASYNVPYFEDVYNASGYPHPSIYNTCPRGRLFRRDAGAAQTVAGLQRVIRGNGYLTDPLSGGMPNNAIAARYDLPVAPSAAGPAAANWTRHPYGAVDAKLTTSALLASRRQLVVAGPTTAGGLPAFSWADPEFQSTPHEGCVQHYDFPWIEVRPRLARMLLRCGDKGWAWGRRALRRLIGDIS